MFSVPRAMSLIFPVRVMPKPAVTSRWYGVMAASRVIWQHSATKWPNSVSFSFMTSSGVRPEWSMRR
jgi:hypothetical protein